MKYLATDEQTQKDLEISITGRNSSIFKLYNKTVTETGGRLLAEFFANPLAEEFDINERSANFQFFSEHGFEFPVTAQVVNGFANYVLNNDARISIQTDKRTIVSLIKDKLASESAFTVISDGLFAGAQLMDCLESFLIQLQSFAEIESCCMFAGRLSSLLKQDCCISLKAMKNEMRTHTERLNKLDYIIRFKDRSKMLELLQLVAELDVFTSVGKLAAIHQFRFAEAVPAAETRLEFKGLWHPSIQNAVKNDVEMGLGKRILFLTGANMAGKSTLMKSLGITLYLAHIGLPVPAKSFTFSVCDGIYTSINLADNLFAGASHYYAEVLRLKEVAIELSRGKRLFVVFDELFRGTNVKDAYDGTVAVTKAFAAYKNCNFIISTHIIEAGDELQKENLPVQYQYLPTIMNGEVPEYPRVLKTGITSDRQGMMIIKNEKILDMLDEGIKLLASEVKRKEEELCLL